MRKTEVWMSRPLKEEDFGKPLFFILMGINFRIISVPQSLNAHLSNMVPGAYRAGLFSSQVYS